MDNNYLHTVYLYDTIMKEFIYNFVIIPIYLDVCHIENLAFAATLTLDNERITTYM